jgi:hypothetical protein
MTKITIQNIWVYPDIPRYPSRIRVPTRVTPIQMGTHRPPPQICIWVPDAQHWANIRFVKIVNHDWMAKRRIASTLLRTCLKLCNLGQK